MYTYPATVERVIDGDTVEVTLDLGFSVKVKQTLRLFGINAPEMKGAERNRGIMARDHLIMLIEKQKSLTVMTVKDKKEKYGRYLARLWGDDDLKCLNTRMVEDGYAVNAEY